MALGCGLISVRGNRGKNYGNEPLVPQKHTKKKKTQKKQHVFAIAEALKNLHIVSFHTEL
jgi:hypothetical protein